jgi:NAD(P)-dependent dehydrogenase (short-subunit alcohol dehydrogenase family)
VAFFKTAPQKYGHVNHAVANAGLIEQWHWFHARGWLDGVEKEPNIAVLDVTLRGVLFFASLMAKIRRSRRTMSVVVLASAGADGQLGVAVLASVAGFTESTGIPLYQACKHDVLGLMRSFQTFCAGGVPRAENQ